jgi:hypothetical protein
MSDVPDVPPDDPNIKNLSMLAFLITHNFEQAMRAAYVTEVAGAWFTQYKRDDRPKFFSGHPSSSMAFTALEALEERALVGVAEQLRDHKNLFPIGTLAQKLRRFEDLYLHRHALSHPVLPEWDDPKMKVFVDQDRPGYDFRAGLLWDLQKSINETLAEAGATPEGSHDFKIHVDSGPHGIRSLVTKDMAIMLAVILDRIRKPELMLPPVEYFVDLLLKGAARFQKLLEAHPDGQVRPQPAVRIPQLRRAAYDDATFTSADAVRCNDVLEYLDHVDWLCAVRKHDEALEALRDPQKAVPGVLPRPHRFSRSAGLMWADQQRKNRLLRSTPLKVDDIEQWRRLIDLAVPMFYRDLVEILARAQATPSSATG